MKKTMIYSLLMFFGLALTSCNKDTYNEPSSHEPNATITASAVGVQTVDDIIVVPAEGATFTVQVTTTGGEWNAYTNEQWFKVAAQNTVGNSGIVTVTVPESGIGHEQTGEIIIMSGTARKALPLMQLAAEQPYYAPEGYELVWHDEFDDGTELNAADWTHEVQGAGWVNHELQNYVSHLTPGGHAVTEVKGGTLRINCLNEGGTVYSGRVYARQKVGWQYGYIEASIKLPRGRGTWPAFWMMPVQFTSWPDSGEIDIMEEVGADPNEVSSSLHANAHVHTNNTQVTHAMSCPGAEGEFHTYAIEWTSQNITTYVDGQVQLSYDNRGLGHDDWPYDAPFYVILNLAWGGDWGGYKGVDDSALPCTMEVDYVRVFQKK